MRVKLSKVELLLSFGLGNVEKHFANDNIDSSYKIIIVNTSEQTIIDQLSRFGILLGSSKWSFFCAILW